MDALVWRLAPDVPDYWIPLIPAGINRTAGASVSPRCHTQRRRSAQYSIGAKPRVHAGCAKTSSKYWNRRSRASARVTCAFQLSRWFNGTTLLWIGRRKLLGRGEGS
jgi:hypothetical protein